MSKPREKIQTLAVLPFTADTSGLPAFKAAARPRQRLMLLGMTDTVVAAAGTAADRAADELHAALLGRSRAPDPVAAGREQGVDAVLTGMISSRRAQAKCCGCGCCACATD